MSNRKWGESFLKSGLPLEHLTLMTFQSAEWYCVPHHEYQRKNKELEDKWFEIDLLAHAPVENKRTTLTLLVECKYHDPSRFWFFLPQDSQRFLFNDRFLNCGPFQSLRNPKADDFSQMAKLSTGGIVISEDGTKQDNAVYTALQQLINGFFPYCLNTMFFHNISGKYRRVGEEHFVPSISAVIPMIVTNAKLFRLRPDLTNLEEIRAATSPHEIADEMDWTWNYNNVTQELFHSHLLDIETHKKENVEILSKYAGVEQRLSYSFHERPNWIAIVNVESLNKVIKSLEDMFLSIDTLSIEEVLNQ